MKFIFTLLSSFLLTTGFGQNIVGDWSGSLEVQGNELPIIFHITKDNAGKHSATFDSPKQNSFNNPCSDIIVKADSVILIIKSINGQYDGKLNEKNNLLTGIWSQSGYTFPLDMKKTSETATIKKINRATLYTLGRWGYST